MTLIEEAAEEANDPVFGTSSKPAQENLPTQSSNQPEKISDLTPRTPRPSRCHSCGAAHSIYACRQFLATTAQQRKDQVCQKGLCHNCLRGNHATANCRSEHSCHKCGQRHHTLIHQESNSLRSVSGVHGAGNHTSRSVAVTNASVSLGACQQPSSYPCAQRQHAGTDRNAL